MLGLWITGTYSYHAMFWTTSTLVVVTLLHGIAAKNTAVQRTAPSASFTTIVANLLEKSAILPSIVSFFLTIVYGAVIFFVALYEASLGIGNAGWFFMAMALAMLLFRPVSGYWSDRGGANIVMLIGYVTLFAGIILVCISRSMPVFLAAGVLMGIGFGFCFPILQTIAVRNASAQRRGAATGTYFLAFDIGIGLGGIIWGYVAEATGYKTMFYITLIPLAAAAVLYWRFKSRMGLKIGKGGRATKRPGASHRSLFQSIFLHPHRIEPPAFLLSDLFEPAALPEPVFFYGIGCCPDSGTICWPGYS